MRQTRLDRLTVAVALVAIVLAPAGAAGARTSAFGRISVVDANLDLKFVARPGLVEDSGSLIPWPETSNETQPAGPRKGPAAAGRTVLTGQVLRAFVSPDGSINDIALEGATGPLPAPVPEGSWALRQPTTRGVVDVAERPGRCRPGPLLRLFPRGPSKAVSPARIGQEGDHRCPNVIHGGG
jgi:hypothetical protein